MLNDHVVQRTMRVHVLVFEVFKRKNSVAAVWFRESQQQQQQQR